MVFLFYNIHIPSQYIFSFGASWSFPFGKLGWKGAVFVHTLSLWYRFLVYVPHILDPSYCWSDLGIQFFLVGHSDFQLHTGLLQCGYSCAVPSILMVHYLVLHSLLGYLPLWIFPLSWYTITETLGLFTMTFHHGIVFFYIQPYAGLLLVFHHILCTFLMLLFPWS